jgi:redox-sensitive bicupin YhaK (pirin superfamily)
MSTTAPSTLNPSTLQQQPTPPAAFRTVEGIHKSTTFHWVGNGFFVSTYFPSDKLPAERVSPFVLMDYGPPKEFAPTAHGKRGVGWHPHRGFETVTLAWEGAVAHRDNKGHAGVIGPGDVQWMTAASGIFHEEYHEEGLTRRGGRMHMMQLWVNLRREDKMAPPAYQAITAADIPTVPVPGGGYVRVIAGEYEGARGPAHTFTPITMLDAQLPEGAHLAAPFRRATTPWRSWPRGAFARAPSKRALARSSSSRTTRRASSSWQKRTRTSSSCRASRSTSPSSSMAPL